MITTREDFFAKIGILKTCQDIKEFEFINFCAQSIEATGQPNGCAMAIFDYRKEEEKLGFTKKYVEITIDFWKRIIWNDESKFESFGQKRRIRVKNQVSS